MKQLHVFLSGNVQGVGLRYTAKLLAAQFGLTGFAKNLPDGRVELLAEGEDNNLQKLIEELKNNFSFDNIAINYQRAQNKYQTFTIEY